MLMKKLINNIFVIVLLLFAVISTGWKLKPVSSNSQLVKNSPSKITTSKNGSSQNKGEKTAEDVFKNIKVLKGMPASRLLPTMHFIEASLGFNCGNCHVRNASGWQFAKDNKPEKRKARSMIKMMNSINKNSFKGHQEVTCFTCHRGNPDPERIPQVTTARLLKENEIEKADEEKEIIVPNRLNTPKQIIDKYISALGGKDALQKIKTLKLQGASQNSGKENELTIYWKAPDMYYSSEKTMRGEMARIFNGNEGWMKFGQYIRQSKGDNLGDLKMTARSFSPLNIYNMFLNLKLDDIKTIGSDTVYILDGTVSKYRSVKLFFNTSSGLLEREIVYDKTPLGKLQTQSDYKDYKNVNGVLFPFETIVSSYDDVRDIKYKTISTNISIDDNLFAAPTKE